MPEIDFLEEHLTSDSADFYLYEHRIKTNIIYKVIVVGLLVAIASLPLIYVDITVSAPSMVRPVFEKSIITTAVSEYVDSVSEIVAICEKDGFIPRYYTDGPQDKVDRTL